MPQRISLITITVLDYDEAIEFYTTKLGFSLLEDNDLGDAKRWVRVAPPGSNSPSLLLARAVGDTQRASVGNQTGGRVFIFIETDDMARDYELLRSRGVRFIRPPTTQPWGTVAVFEDLYTNKFDLIERPGSASPF